MSNTTTLTGKITKLLAAAQKAWVAGITSDTHNEYLVEDIRDGEIASIRKVRGHEALGVVDCDGERHWYYRGRKVTTNVVSIYQPYTVVRPRIEIKREDGSVQHTRPGSTDHSSLREAFERIDTLISRKD